MHSIFNVVNLFMGVGLLSLPYSIKIGGWMAMPALILATLMFALSGHLIVEGFRKVSCCFWGPQVPHSFADGDPTDPSSSTSEARC